VLREKKNSKISVQILPLRKYIQLTAMLVEITWIR